MAKLGMFLKTLGTKIAALWKTTTWFKIASIGGAVVIATSAVVIPNAVISETGGIFHKCDFSIENIDANYSYSAANCTEKAKYYYSCACGEKGTDLFEYGDVLGHDLTHHESKQVTCTDIGFDAYDTCSRCDYTTYIEINATGHTDGEWITDVDATCTEDGSKHQICSVCNDTIKTEVISATGHTDGEWITDVDAICTEDGSKHQICSVCNDTIKTEVIPTTGHHLGEWITEEPTCNADGSKYQICSICNNKCNISVIKVSNPFSVSFKRITFDKMSDGSYMAIFELTTDIIGSWEVSWEVFDENLEYPYLSVGWCPAKYIHAETNNKSQLNNSIIIANIRDASGNEIQYQIDVFSQEISIIKVINVSAKHTEVVDAAVASTCTTDGKTEGKHCSVCNATLVAQKTIPATGHAIGEWIIDVNATCTEDGRKHQVCSVCNDTIETAIPAMGHEYVKAVTKATAESNASILFTCNTCEHSYTEIVSPINVIVELTGTGITVSGSVYYSRSFEVTASGGFGRYQYRFESGSNLLQDYTTDNTITVYGNSLIDYATIKITVMDEIGQKTVYEIKGNGSYVNSYVLYE